MIKVQRKNRSTFEWMTPTQLEKWQDFSWSEKLVFQTDKIEQKVRIKTAWALRKNHITLREKFLGVNFYKELALGLRPNLSLRYLDEHIGYGIFAEEEIPSGTFIGEYTGVVRKRLGKIDRKNDYTFEYGIGRWRHNPFIIDAKGEGNLTRFINHGVKPNLESISVFANGVIHIILMSIETIPKEAQLCYDYGALYWKKRQKSLIDL